MIVTFDVRNAPEVARDVVAAYLSYSSPSSSLRMLSEAISALAAHYLRLGLKADATEYSARATELAKLARAWRASEEAILSESTSR